jgi:hypothetical protein
MVRQSSIHMFQIQLTHGQLLHMLLRKPEQMIGLLISQFPPKMELLHTLKAFQQLRLLMELFHMLMKLPPLDQQKLLPIQPFKIHMEPQLLMNQLNTLMVQLLHTLITLLLQNMEELSPMFLEPTA